MVEIFYNSDVEADQSAYISVKAYAHYRGIHPNTVIRWIKIGKVPAEQPGGRKGRYAIPAQMIDKHNYPPVPGWPERPI